MTDTWNQDIEKIIQALHTILYFKNASSRDRVGRFYNIVQLCAFVFVVVGMWASVLQRQRGRRCNWP